VTQVKRIDWELETFMHFYPYYQQTIQRLGTKETQTQDSNRDYVDQSYINNNLYMNHGVLTEQAIFNANKKSAEMAQIVLTKDLLMMCCSTVRGYSLNLNQWSQYFLTLISWVALANDYSAFPDRLTQRD
jgi:hypothetical protein